MNNIDNNTAENKYGIDQEWLYQDFTMAGSDWGILFSSLLQHLHVLQQNEKYAEAVHVCDVLLKYEEPYAAGGPFLIKCECLTAMGKLEDAAAAYEQYINQSDAETDTTIKYAYYNLGNIYFEMKRYNEAKDLFTKAHNIDPSAGGPSGMLAKLAALESS